MRHLILLAVLIGSWPVLADPPSMEFGPAGLTIRGVRGNAKVVWLGMVRERVNNHVRVRFVRGASRATAGVMTIAEPNADRSSSLWTVVDGSDGNARHSAAPRFTHSGQQIDIQAAPGATTIAFESAMVELLYVRPGAGAWTFGTGDGSDLDGDLESNGTVVMPLNALKSLDDDTPPPTHVEKHDVIMVIDPTGRRVTRLVVSK